MAQSPSHKWGQIIGDMLEAAIEPLLSRFADQHKLYLDKKGMRPARSGNKVSWTDLNGNTHDLDFVLERDGTSFQIGTPVAFIETAWRRYTKHSRNKAQEIQGAIEPLLNTYNITGPFAGVVLAGVFTEGALNQLKSLGFAVVYFHYDTVVDVFSLFGIDASSDEDTPDFEFAAKVEAWDALTSQQRNELAKKLIEANSVGVQHFMDSLEKAANRMIESIRVFPLHGVPVEWSSVEDAINFIVNYEGDNDRWPLVRYEIAIRYTNGDRVEGRFESKEQVLKFLRSCQV